MESEQKLYLTLALGFLIIVLGTIGYTLIEDWPLVDSLYMTVITLSTVGFKEVYPLSDNGHLFTIFIIIFGAFIAAFTIKVAAQLILEGQLREILGKRKMEKLVQKLKDHIILSGYGRVGRQVAEKINQRRVPFVVIEKDESMIPEKPESGFIFLQGNAAEDEMLEKAGIHKAKAIVSTLPDDAENVYLALTARQLNSKIFIIGRAESNLAKRKLIRAGADKVICPHELGGTQMAMATLRPNIVDFMQLASEVSGGEGLGIEEISIKEGGKLTGKTIIEAAIKSKYDAIVVGLRKNSSKLIFNPSGETTMEHGDILIVLGANDKLEQLALDLA